MKKLLMVFALANFSTSFAQTLNGVKVYISNPYVERGYVIKTQMYNMDYIRSHYATSMFSMEKNYVGNLYDSLEALPLTRVTYDSIELVVPSAWGGGTLNMNFEPCIVIDFIMGNRYNLNEEIWTFSLDRRGYICKTEHSEGNVLFYPDKRCIDFLKRQFPGLFYIPQ